VIMETIDLSLEDTMITAWQEHETINGTLTDLRNVHPEFCTLWECRRFNDQCICLTCAEHTDVIRMAEELGISRTTAR
jgi:hypothetical protein